MALGTLGTSNPLCPSRTVCLVKMARWLDNPYYHMTRTAPRAISLETHKKKVLYEGRTRQSDRAGKNAYGPSRNAYKKVKVKSAYEPSGPPGRSLSRFPWHEATRNISTPPWMGCQSIAGLPPALNSPVPIYTPGWREAP